MLLSDSSAPPTTEGSPTAEPVLNVNIFESYLSTLNVIRTNICRQRDQALANYHEACGAVQALDAALEHARTAFAGPPEAPEGDQEKEVACPPTTP